jgi:hypothetical protein
VWGEGGGEKERKKEKKTKTKAKTDTTGAMNFNREGLNKQWAIRKLICSSYAETYTSQYFTYH